MNKLEELFSVSGFCFLFVGSKSLECQLIITLLIGAGVLVYEFLRIDDEFDFAVM